MENQQYDTHVKAIRDKDDLIVSVAGTMDEMCYMVGEIVCSISRETGADYRDLLNKIGYVTENLMREFPESRGEHYGQN